MMTMMGMLSSSMFFLVEDGGGIPPSAHWRLGEMLTLALATSLVGYLTWHYVTDRNKRGSFTIWPFVGQMPCIMQHMHDLFDVVAGFLEKSPNMAIFGAMPGVKEIATANPAHIQYILKDNFQNYPKGDTFCSCSREVLGYGIFASDGEPWVQQRKVASYEFSTNSLRDLMLVAAQSEAKDWLLPVLHAAQEAKKPLDMQDIFLRYTLDNICLIAFGSDPKALAPSMPDLPFMKALDRATEMITMRAIQPGIVWKTLRALGVGKEAQLVQDVKTLDGFVGSTVCKSWIMGNPLTTFLRDACINFIIAGRDTSATALSWLFWILDKRTDVQHKVVTEVREVLKLRGESGPSLDEQPFSYNELKELKYTQAVINETLRLYPPVPVDSKTAAEADTFPDGTKVGKGWRVTYNIYAVGRMTRVWGEDAREFKPDRWLTEMGEVKVESPFKFPVFNAGPRLCLGRDMVYLQLKTVLASVLMKHRLEVYPGHDVTYKLGVTLFMKNGLLMRVLPRVDKFALRSKR